MVGQPEDFTEDALALAELIAEDGEADQTVVMIIRQALAAAWRDGWLAHATTPRRSRPGSED